jgi:dynein heavy chain
MLTSGVVPTLFSPEDKDGMFESVREEVKQKGMIDTAENCWKVFIYRCRDNLHIVLCFSPSGDDLRRRCRDFSGMVSNTGIDWFDPWPEEALSAVSTYFLEGESKLISEQVLPQIVAHMVFAHKQIIIHSSIFSYQARRPVHVTPTNFLDYISTFRRLLNDKNDYMRQKNSNIIKWINKIIVSVERS